MSRLPDRCWSFPCTTTQQTRNQANNNDSKKGFQKGLIGIVFSRHARKLKSRKQPPPLLLLIDRFPCAPRSLFPSCLHFSPSLNADLPSFVMQIYESASTNVSSVPSIESWRWMVGWRGSLRSFMLLRPPPEDCCGGGWAEGPPCWPKSTRSLDP